MHYLYNVHAVGTYMGGSINLLALSINSEATK